MPTELLAFPPAYTIVGAYRLWNDPSIREPVLAKIKHASVRGLAVGAAYAVFGWGMMDWVVRRFTLRGKAGDVVTVGVWSFAFNVDVVFCELARGGGVGFVTVLTPSPRLHDSLSAYWPPTDDLSCP